MTKKTNTLWKKEIPTEEGWYWIKYSGKHGTVRCPCSIVIFKDATVIHTAKNDMFTDKTRKCFGFSKCMFGPKIEVPK